MKKLIIVVLVILLLGLYYYTEETKDMMQKTGFAAKLVTNEVKEKGIEYTKEQLAANKKTRESDTS